MKLEARELPRAAFALGVIGSIIVLLSQSDANSLIVTPTLCFLWCFASLWVMGPLRSLERSQILLAVLALALALGVSIYYKFATPNESVGRLVLIALFACFILQALLRGRLAR